MGLKDLVAQKAALTEEAIEAIIADYMRFDTDEMEIVFTPDFASLSNRARILVYLVGLQGWPFVADEAVSTAAKPAVIGEILRIPGGTLRPILKDLKDSHLIAVKSGAYSVRASHLESVKAAVMETSSRTSATKKTGKKTAKKKAQPKGKDAGGKRKNRGLGEIIAEWITEGFFDDGKTTGDVRNRFHEETIIIPVSSIPIYVNKAVAKEKTLTRKKEEVNGKRVWVYRTKK